MKSRSMKALALGLSAVLAFGAFTGCGSKGGSSSSESGAATNTASEKVLKFGCAMYTDGLVNPAYDTNSAWNAMRYGVAEALFKFDDNMVAQPWLAESYEVTEDHLTWTIKLKEGIKFSNGTDMTATKVKEALDYVREEGPNGSSAPQKFLEFEAEVTADDANNTITIQTVTPYINLPGNLAYPVMAIVDYSESDNKESGIIGTGPYAIAEFTDQVGYNLVKNENYYEDVPYDKVELLFMGDNTAKAMALQNGQVDLVENITSISDIEKFQADENYTVEITSGIRCGFAWINFNGVLGNDTLRKAMLKGIDYKAICESNTIGGLYTPGFSVLPSNLAYGYDNLTNPYEYDPEAAKAELDAAGIVDTDGDGIRELDGQNINLKFVSYENRLLNDFADAQTQYLSQIGIGVTAAYGSSDDQWSSLVAGEYDLNQNNWTTVGTGDPKDYMGNWATESGANYCGFQDDRYDELYAASQTETDADKRAEIFQEMQQILVDEGVAIIDGYYNSLIVYSKNVAEAHIHSADYYWLSTEIKPAE